MEQKKRDIKPISYRPNSDVRDFLESTAAKTFRSNQGMLDFFMTKIMDMEKKGEFIIQ